MSFLADMKRYGRFAWGLRSFLRHTISLEEAQATVRRRMAERESNFLRLVEHGIFGYRRSPYLPLLKLARCELGDVRSMVRTKGLEETLRALRRAGVYVSFEEFKGREPMVRDGQVIHVQAGDFDNPHLGQYYQAESGGTTGAMTRVAIDLDHLVDHSPHMLLTENAHGLIGVPTAIWHGVPPDSTGLQCLLLCVRFGHVSKRWFTPVTSRDLRRSLRHCLATPYLFSIISIGRLLGVPMPWPEPVSLDQAATVARWAVETIKTHGACLIRTHVSKALRVCIAARDQGLDLTGATFLGGGEPPTAAKVQGMIQVGARWIPMYWFTEAGCVGQGCARPADGNDIHLFKDGLALTQYPRKVPGSEITVLAFNFTTLLPSTPKLLLNVESDDYGVIETRSCGCPLEAYGFTDHLRHIRSFRKLTGEGATLVGSTMIHILEEVLPARFGGGPLDYQLLEEEDEQGLTRLSLLISPKIQIADETAVVAALLDALGQTDGTADSARALWKQARTIRVERMEPIWTGRGKLMPLHLAKAPHSASVPKP
ncbi:MAG: hypothetical protein A3F90_12710 [Deltaproteobacteria bacterium RIFCSPLOWO2_12_FULL_60_19]|nr:MAG: hypothetical protein A3F90_12710 [Deltaproteobacteria bacterium RIFCSPLOWO2_12_FULL_60_19]